MTIIGSALRNDLDVHAYLEDVLRRALAGETDWSALTPHTWKQSHPSASAPTALKSVVKQPTANASPAPDADSKNSQPRTPDWFWCTVTRQIRR